ncbi:unnamed protein product [Urochloa humidicola]
MGALLHRWSLGARHRPELASGAARGAGRRSPRPATELPGGQGQRSTAAMGKLLATWGELTGSAAIAASHRSPQPPPRQLPRSRSSVWREVLFPMNGGEHPLTPPMVGGVSSAFLMGDGEILFLSPWSRRRELPLPPWPGSSLPSPWPGSSPPSSWPGSSSPRPYDTARSMLMALEAIYGDDLAVFENKGGLHYFQIYIRYDVADGVEVCAKLSAPNTSTSDVGCLDGSEHDSGPDEFSYTCKFEYLPPLILTCLLPKSYPSKDPPSLAVTAKWMDGPNVSQLCEMLDTIWTELPGQEVVYQWVEWLRNTSRPYLWTDGSMTLGPDIATHNTR